MQSKKKIVINEIQDKIFNIRDKQVMLDFDLAELYQVETRILNQAVKRNVERFPKEFMFQLTEDELVNLRSQFVTSRVQHGGRRKLSHVFTEQGVAMLAGVLRSEVAIGISIKIINSFVEMRNFLSLNANLFQRLDNIETKQFQHKLESDKNFQKIFNAIEDKSIKPKQGIFYNGQIFDAYIFVLKIIKSANKEIILIDNYVDETVLQLFTKRKKRVKVTIYTQMLSKTLEQDLEKYNQQHRDKKIEIKTFKKAHDKFIVVDSKIIYHFGASLKDLGKKWFAFSKLEIDVKNILNNLNKK